MTTDVPHSAVSLDMSRRDERALAMRISGVPESDIARKFGWTPEETHAAIERALVRATVERDVAGVAHMRKLTQQRLDALLAGFWETATDSSGHPVIQQGAAKVALGIMDRQTALYGTNAPKETIVTHNVTAEQIAGVLDRLFAARAGVVEATVLPAIGAAESDGADAGGEDDEDDGILDAVLTDTDQESSPFDPS